MMIRLLVQQLRKLQPSEITRYLNRNSPFSGIWENIVQQHDDELPEETRRLIVEFLHPRYKKIFTDRKSSFCILFACHVKPSQQPISKRYI